MHRLTHLLALSFLLGGCAPKQVVVRDPIVVEQHRSRITKLRHTIDETRQVIAASQGAPYLPELLMRLAELTSEEARYHYLVAYEREQGRAEALHLPQVRILKEQAIATYEQLVATYPTSPLAHEALYNLALEQQELGEFDAMRDALQRLVTKYPASGHQADALLLLGNYHFDKSELQEAATDYQKVVQLGDSPILGLAHYKLAWVEMNLGDCPKSLTSFEAALDAAKDHRSATVAAIPARPAVGLDGFVVPDPPRSERAGGDAVEVQREALIDLTYCYATVRKPQDAADYLRKRATSRDIYVAALSKMARRFMVVEQPQGAAAVLRELLRYGPDNEDRLEDVRMLHTVLHRTRDYRHVGDDVALMTQAYERRVASLDLGSEARAALTDELESLTRDLTLRSDQALRGVNTSEYAENAATRAQTIAAYRAYFATFGTSWQHLDLQLNLADLLLEEERWAEAAQAYRDAAALLAASGPVGEDGPTWTDADRVDALYNAAVAYQTSLRQGGDRVSLTTGRAGLRVVGGEVLRTGALDKERTRTVQYAIGRSYYDEGTYTRAIPLLTAVAYAYPGTEEGETAVDLVLDSYNTRDDISGLIAVGRRFAATDSPLAANTKTRVLPIISAAEQRRLDDLSLAASGDQAGGMEVLLAFADRYQDTDLGERALLGTFVAARASGDSARVSSVGAQILERYPKSTQAAGVASTMGQVAAGRYVFDDALRYLELGAELGSDPAQQVALRLTAGELYEQLGDAANAERCFRAAMELAPDPARHQEALAHLASLLERSRSGKELVKALEALPDHPEVVARLGMAQLRAGDVEAAEATLSAVADAPMASNAATARATYGMAEASLALLEQFEAYPDLSLVEELVAMVELSSQYYLQAASQGDLAFSLGGLGRVARVAQVGAQKLESFPLPDELSELDKAAVREALQSRAIALYESQEEALTACASRAKAAWYLDASAVACIHGEVPTHNLVQPVALASRHPASPPDLDAYRDRLSRNPDDVEALRAIGRAFLQAGDAHAARVALGRVVTLGALPDDYVALADALDGVGDHVAATQALGRGHEAGSSAATARLQQALERLGLTDLATSLQPAGGAR